jgi:hypothetical protein
MVILSLAAKLTGLKGSGEGAKSEEMDVRIPQ